jgi:NAD(P)H-hydrate epimerase
MAEIDRRTIQELGLDGQVLMETAGRSLAQWLHQRVPGHKVAFLCGPGNNGGDGLVAARAWSDLGGRAQLFLLSEDLQGDARVNLQRAQRWDLARTPLGQEPPDWEGYAWVVDALFGTGLTRNLSPQLAAWARSLPADRTLAVDIPSGIHAATGQVLGAAVQAHTTLTFGLPKLGQLLQPGASHCGHLVVQEIGFPRQLTHSEEWPGQWVTAEQVGHWLPQRGPGSHKRSVGKLLVVAGSSQYPGAALLSTLGALRGGAGLVYTYTAPSVAPRLAAEAIPLVGAHDFLTLKDLEPLQRALTEVDALCLGPGLGSQPETLDVVRQLLTGNQLPAVVDASALQGLPEQLSPRILITPHHGELARLLRAKVADIERDRLSYAVRAARNWNCTVLLKGDPTLVTTAGGRYLVSNQGTAVLAQGGTGDVLSGLAGALLAQGMGALEAGGVAAYVHGRAGRLSGVTCGLGAEALAGWLPQALG